MEFDLILTNPPFQDTTRRGKTPHKLWIDFTRLELERLLKDGGALAQISPASFQSPNSRVLALMKRYRTAIINFDTSAYFQGVASTFADYLIYKEPQDGASTTVVHRSRSFQMHLDEEVFYIPNDLTEAGFAIHRKVVFRARERLKVEWDYVTCHNVRIHDDDSILSRSRTARHVHPILHTNAQTWWSSVRQAFADEKKVMWSRSGYTKPFYDDGRLGGTDMAYYVRVETPAEGEALSHNLNLELLHYIYRTARWSGFGNERVFAALPNLPRDRRLSNDEAFDMFGLTCEEVRHVRHVLG